SGQYGCSISNNTISNNVFPSTSGHTFYGIFNTSTGGPQDENSNTVSGNTGSGSGTFYGVYYGGAPGAGVTVNVNNNTVTNFSKTTATGTGSIYGIYQASSPVGTVNMNNNTVS